MKKNSGFTLIELLAVLVVLAILAAVITPQISKSIEQSKMGTAIESANGVIRTVESYMISSNKKYGKVDLLSSDLKYSGAKPQAGEAEINKEGKIRLYTYFNNYCVTKEYDKEPYATKMSKELCGWFATDNYENEENESGSVLTFDSSDTNNEVVNYIIKGNSTQETRSGKNLWDFNNSFTGTTKEQNGIKFTKRANDILINGTSTAQAYTTPYEMLSKLTVGKTYTIATNNSNAHGIFQYYESGSTTPKYTSTLTITSTMTSVKAYFYINPNVTVNNVAINMQLEEGSTATKFQKYGAMPSIEFPSEISSTGDLLTTGNCASYGSNACNNVGKYIIPVKVSGKNIFDYNNIPATFGSKHDNGYYTDKMSNVRIYTYQTLKHYIGKKVTVSFDLTTSEDGTFLIYPYQTNGIGIRFSMISKEMKANTKTRITATGVVEVLGTNETYSPGEIIVYKNGYTGSYLVNNIQFEVGEQATDYEAYNGITTDIYLDEPLRKVGNYVDYIDYDNKKIVRNVKERVYTGKEYWYADGTSYVFDSTEAFIKSTKGSLLSNIAFYASTKNNDNFNFARSGAGYIEFNALNKGYTVETWKQYLVNKYNSGSPAKVQYDIATPEEQTIDLPLIESNGNIRNVSLGCNTAASSISFSITK